MTENELCVAPGEMMRCPFCMLYSRQFLKILSGDVVNFIWDTNHNVDPVATKEDYDNCVVSNHHLEAGPLAWTAPEGGGCDLCYLRGQRPLQRRQPEAGHHREQLLLDQDRDFRFQQVLLDKNNQDLNLYN